MLHLREQASSWPERTLPPDKDFERLLESESVPGRGTAVAKQSCFILTESPRGREGSLCLLQVKQTLWRLHANESRDHLSAL